MIKLKYKIACIVWLLLLVTSNNFAQYSNVKKELNKVMKNKFFESSVCGIDVYDLTAKKSVYTKNEKLLLHPASTNKIITTSTALINLGPDYEFITSVYHTGPVIDSVCFGDIFIVGGANPDFTSLELDTLIREIRNYGIKEIAGNLYGDVSMFDSVYWGEGWMWDDDPGLSAAYITPLTINDNGTVVYYEPRFSDNKVDIKLKYPTNTTNIINKSITTVLDTNTFKITRDWKHQKNDILISGMLPYDESFDSTGVNFIHPEFHFLALAKENLENRNIKLNGFVDTLTMPESAKLIYSHGRKFLDVIKNLNKESDNLSAELTLRTIGYKAEGKRASYGDGLKVVYKMLTQLDYAKNDFRIVDGSGLSHYNLITAEILTKLLSKMYYDYNDLFAILQDSFPIAGVDGTLERRMTNGHAHKNVKAKTGTLSGVSCLSGYLTSANNHKIAFTIMMQNSVNHTSTARKIQDQICEILCGIK